MSVTIPVYHSDEALPKRIACRQPVLAENSDSCEVILVDDCDQTDTWRVIEDLSAGRSWIRGIRLMHNLGQHNAMLCGIREARYEIIVTMDDDLQNPPEEIFKLVAKRHEGHDGVHGAPLQGRAYPVSPFWPPSWRSSRAPNSLPWESSASILPACTSAAWNNPPTSSDPPPLSQPLRLA